MAGFLSPFLKIGIILARFHAWGTLASPNDLLNKSVMGSSTCVLHAFSMRGERPSGPGDLF